MQLYSKHSYDVKHVDIRAIIVSLLMILPFFDPMCLTYLREGADSSFATNAIYYCFIMARVVVSFWAILACAKTVKINDDLWFMGFVVAVAVVATLGATQVFTIAQCFTYLGLIATLRYIFMKDFEPALIACIVLFAAYAFGNFLSVYVLHGIIKGQGPASTIYFFGGKNSIFMHGITLLVSLCAYCLIKKGKVSFIAIVLCFAYALTALHIDSISSFVCFAVLGILLLDVNYKQTILKFLRAPVLLLLLAFGFCVTVIAQQTDLISTISEMLGRSVSRSGSMSGRTEIWSQALSYIAVSPFIGNPEGTTYLMSNGVSADHAHSFFLNLAAQSGMIPLTLFVIDLFVVSMKVDRMRRNLAVGVLFVFWFVLLAHSLFDVMDLYVYIMIRALLMRFIDSGMQFKPNTAFLLTGAWSKRQFEV